MLIEILHNWEYYGLQLKSNTNTTCYDIDGVILLLLLLLLAFDFGSNDI